MPSIKRLYIRRVYLCLFGICLGLLTVEVVLRLYVTLLNEQKTYTFNKQIVYDIAKQQRESASGYIRDDTQEEYRSQSHPKRVIYALGDSFTNGGNLDFTSSYPYQLHHSFNQNSTIHNMGVCESSSIDTQRAITKLLQQKVEPGSIFLILTGATDIFAGHNDTTITMATPLIKSQNKKVIQETKMLSFLNYFKSYLLVKEMVNQFLWIQSSPELSYDLKIVQKLNQITNSQIYNECLLSFSSGHCLAKEVDHKLALESRDIVLDYLLKLNLGMDSDDYAQQIRSLLDYLKVHGEILEDFSWVDVSATLTFLTSKQSQFSTELVFNELESIFNQFPHEKEHLFHQALSNISEAIANRETLLKKRERRLSQIISTLRSKHMVPILMTYPLPYSEVNESIRKVAKDSNVDFIDLEKVFRDAKEKESEQLLVDYQHLTRKGNSIMAKTIHRYIVNRDL